MEWELPSIPKWLTINFKASSISSKLSTVIFIKDRPLPILMTALTTSAISLSHSLTRKMLSTQLSRCPRSDSMNLERLSSPKQCKIISSPSSSKRMPLAWVMCMLVKVQCVLVASSLDMMAITCISLIILWNKDTS